MKAKVMMKYIDKEDDEIKYVGTTVEITEERFKEITKAGPYLVPVDEPEEEEAEPEKAEPEKEETKTADGEKTEKKKGKK